IPTRKIIGVKMSWLVESLILALSFLHSLAVRCTSARCDTRQTLASRLFPEALILPYRPNHDGELPHHMPSVDESLIRMKLQTHSIPGPFNDLQTFIRSSSFIATKRLLSTPLCSGPIWNNTSALT